MTAFSVLRDVPIVGANFSSHVLRYVACGLLIVAAAARGAAAQPPPLEPPVGQEAGLAPGELQQLVDALELQQAQERLRLTDAQFPQFITRLRTLQQTRRRTENARQRLIGEMNRLLNEGEPDEAQLKDRLRALQELDSRSAAELRKAYDAIDQVLDTRQQARFRVFEQQMERRKLDLIARARRQPPPARGRLNRP